MSSESFVSAWYNFGGNDEREVFITVVRLNRRSEVAPIIT
jgi:hypothetical protein